MTKTKRGQDEPTVIKKYANRRLYDTGRSSYVTLEDLSEMINEGYEFVVYDAKTGEDITRSVLAQIIAEKEAAPEGPEGGADSLMPTSFMRKLIPFYSDENFRKMMPSYLEQSMEMFVSNQEKLREQMNKSLESLTKISPMGAAMGGMGTMNPVNAMSQMTEQMKAMTPMKGLFAMPGLEELSKQNMAMFERTMKMFAPFVAAQARAAGSSAVSTPAAKSQNKEEKIRALREKIAELQQEVTRIAAE